MPRPLPVAVLVSGEGTTLDGFAEALLGGHVPARIVLVVSDRPHVPAIERARRRGLPTAVLPYRGVQEDVWAQQLTEALAERGTELVILAGFLSILPSSFVREWSGRVINLHPALLPRYGGRGRYGRRVHEEVLRAGERETGVTVHLVTEEVDQGPILEQRRLAVETGDTPESLRERLHPLEVRALEDVVRRFAERTWPLPYRASAERAPTRENRGTPG